MRVALQGIARQGGAERGVALVHQPFGERQLQVGDGCARRGRQQRLELERIAAAHDVAIAGEEQFVMQR